MTAPEQPTVGEIMRAVGRLENAMDKLGNQFESVGSKLGDKQGEHTELLVRHDERLSTLERAAQHAWERWGLWIAVLAALASNWLPHPWK